VVLLLRRGVLRTPRRAVGATGVASLLNPSPARYRFRAHPWTLGAE
jgi:hypothetical protein